MPTPSEIISKTSEATSNSASVPMNDSLPAMLLAMMAYACGMQGFFDRIALAYFVACGVSRLARFNITAEDMSDASGKVRYFEGTPIPTSVLLVAMLVVAAARDAVGPRLWWGGVEWMGLGLHPLVMLFALSGSLMISRIRVPKW